MKGAIQLGIGYTVGNLTSKPDRDVLMQDFYVVESVFLPRSVLCSASPLRSAFILRHTAPSHSKASLIMYTFLAQHPFNILVPCAATASNGWASSSESESYLLKKHYVKVVTG